tara:strand:- start:394 stop:633 length:240 start_codon:yes stop_codon:yes gene_type:complete
MKKWNNGTYQNKSNVEKEKIIADRIYLVQESKREDIIKKMQTREIFTNKTTNPYMIDNSYIKDLEIQQSFLIPQNSNFK